MLDKIRKQMRWLYLAAAVFAATIGGFAIVMGNNAGNPVTIVLGLGGIMIAIFLLNRWRDRTGARIINTGDKIHKDQANCLAISPNYIQFMHLEVDKLLGLSQKCYNDNKFYHVHRLKDDDTHVAWELPDDDESERSYDPHEMANVVTMPSNKKYFTWSSTFMQKVYTGIMVIIILAEIIGLIAVEG